MGHSPLTSRSRKIQHCVQDFPQVHPPRGSAPLGLGQMRFQRGPLFIAQIARGCLPVHIPHRITDFLNRLYQTIQRKLETNRVVALIEPRQCGKTTLARELVSPGSVNYSDLEDPLSQASLDQPMASLQECGWDFHT